MKDPPYDIIIAAPADDAGTSDYSDITQEEEGLPSTA